MTFNIRYFTAAILLFITEVMIAIYAHDAFIRPLLGDLLVVMLMYCFIKSFFKVDSFTTAVGVLIFSFVIELSQYFHLVQFLGLGNSKLAVIVMGSYFSFVDLVMYTLGTLIILLSEKFNKRIDGKLS